jgi:hypothetical protein
MTRFISPPDIVDLENKAVLLVDFPYDDIEKIALYCKTADEDYDILLYSPNEHQREWLDWAFATCDTAIVNLNYTINTLIKAQMVIMPKTLYVGNLDIMQNRCIESPLEYFQQ